MVRVRQQLLRIADVHGWEVANNFGGSDLVQGDSSEKRLNEAIKAAAKTTKRRVSWNSSSSKPTGLPVAQQKRPRGGAATFKGVCYKCDSAGHKANNCPKAGKASASK